MTTRSSLQDQGRQARTAPGVREWLAGGGWHVVRGTAHRGVLHPDEYVDTARLLASVERELGFTRAELREVYVQGRKSAAQLELRARIDARLLNVARAGGNVSALARATGFDPGVFQKALARADQRSGLPDGTRSLVRCSERAPARRNPAARHRKEMR